MEQKMKKRIIFVLTVASLVFVTGCNTIKGIGRDIEQGGEAIQRAF